MLERLKTLNPDIEFFSVYDKEFAPFGRVITDFDASSIIEAAKKIKKPERGAAYVASEESFEALPAAKEIEKRFFGTLPAQAGYCWGYNTMMNATEWHTASEINITVTPLVLILGHIWDIENNTIDSSKFKAFYVPAGVTLEAYATSLHYCACQVSDEGFGCYIGLPKGTNTSLEEKTENALLVAKNKWLIAHTENTQMVNDGCVGGITGVNFEIKY